MRNSESRSFAGELITLRLAIVSALIFSGGIFFPLGQGQSAPLSSSSGQCTARVLGSVVDSVTHRPVGEAAVTLTHKGAVHIHQVADVEGHFDFTRVCPGDVRIRAQIVNYESSVIHVVARAGQTKLTEILMVSMESIALGEVIEMSGQAPIVPHTQSVTHIEGEVLARRRGQDLSGVVSQASGVRQLRSGSGMGNPIIRGHVGRRVALRIDGLRHRSQNWGLDHAPEIDPFVYDRISVVRGTAGVLYGADAIGGAMLVESPKPRTYPGVDGELHLVGLSNGWGGNLAGRVQGMFRDFPQWSWRLDAGQKRQASLRSPWYPLDNTALAESSLGVGISRSGANAEYSLSYRRYMNKAGVCSCLKIDSAATFFEQLDRDRPVNSDLYRQNFDIDRPFQQVSHDTAVLRAKFERDKVGEVVVTYGLQYDNRKEFDTVRSATGPQFLFRLLSHDVDLRLAHRPLHINERVHMRGTIGIEGSAQTHTYRGLPLIPSYRDLGFGAFWEERLIAHNLELAAGVRYNILHRRANLTRASFLRIRNRGLFPSDACGAESGNPQQIIDCDTRFHSVATTVGGIWQVTNATSLRMDASSTSRAPNPDEQYLHGVSPTSPVFVLGNPGIRMETIYSASVTAQIQKSKWALELSGFANDIRDYIYFAPALDEQRQPLVEELARGTLPRFDIRNIDTVFYGIDGSGSVRVRPWLMLDVQASYVRAQNRTDNTAVTFVPPAEIKAAVEFGKFAFAGLHGVFCRASGTYTARQSHFDVFADLAPPPPAYFLLDVQAGFKKKLEKQILEVGIAASNVLGGRYRDYASLLRYFADRPGAQVTLRASMYFGS